MRYSASPDGRDEAIVNFKFNDRNGVGDNRLSTVKKFPGTTTVARPSDGWLYEVLARTNVCERMCGALLGP